MDLNHCLPFVSSKIKIKAGIKEIIELELTKEEQYLFLKSINILKEIKLD